jgi:lysophospholipase
VNKAQAPARVLVLYTGGTIGMKESERGYEPVRGHLGEVLSKLPQFHDPSAPGETELGLPEDSGPLYRMPPSRFGRRVVFSIKEYEPLLDSSNMGMEDWARIARDVAEQPGAARALGGPQPPLIPQDERLSRARITPPLLDPLLED